MPDSKSDKQPAPAPSACEYISLGIGCPMPAVWSDSVRDGGPWFCHFHKDIGNRDPAKPEVIEFERLVAKPDCRRELMALWYTDWREELRAQILAANPRWLKGDDEPTGAYQARMLAELHLLHRRKPLPTRNGT